MKIIYSYLKNFLPELNVPVKKLTDDLTMIGHLLGGLETRDGETVIDLEVRQNRGDCLGYYGIAKDLSVFYNIPLKAISPASLAGGYKLKADDGLPKLPIEIRAANEVKRIQAVRISNLKNKPSPQWLKTFLALHGINSIDTIVDLTNFIMLWYGIPCHAFDTKKTTDHLIWELNKGKYEKMTTFDGTELKLPPETLIVSNPEKVLSLSMIGGANSGIDLDTAETIIEMAVYDRIRVRRDYKTLKVATEAAIRLEKDLDTELIPQAFAHLANLTLENCGGQISSQISEVYNEKPKILKIDFDPKKPSVFAGINIPKDFSIDILKLLGCTIENIHRNEPATRNSQLVNPPTLRKDLNIEEDLIEEVIRFYGYNKIPTNQPIDSQQLPDITPLILYLINAVKTTLVNLGYDEVRSWPIIQEKYKVINEELPKEAEFIYTQNSINSDYPVLRMSIISSLLHQKKQYDKYKVPAQQFFEIGKVFYKIGENYSEHYSLGIYHPDKEKLTEDTKKLLDELRIMNYELKIKEKDSDCFSEINLEKLLEKSPQIPIASPSINIGNSTYELTSQIIELDANVTLPNEVDPMSLIQIYSNLIDEHLWQLIITDIYKDQALNNYKYTFRAFYQNIDNKTAKRIHAKAFNLKIEEPEIPSEEVSVNINKTIKTEQLYYLNMYEKETKARVIDVKDVSGVKYIVLDKTVFYPEGGGQPSDEGLIIGKKSQSHVKHVIYKNDQVLHQVDKTDFNLGEEVTAQINWNHRHKYMRVHTGGHLLHDVLMKIMPDIKPIKGNHGKNAYLLYEGIIKESVINDVEKELTKKIPENLPIIAKEVSYQELVDNCPSVPSNLPKNKPLRMLKIGDYPAMADGGIHLKSTAEIGEIKVIKIEISGNQSMVLYKVE